MVMNQLVDSPGARVTFGDTWQGIFGANWRLPGLVAGQQPGARW